jgi:hypothetical protein
VIGTEIFVVKPGCLLEVILVMVWAMKPMSVEGARGDGARRACTEGTTVATAARAAAPMRNLMWS